MPQKTDRKAQLLKAALKLAQKRGYASVTREAIASECEVSPALVTFYFGTTQNMKRDLMRAAVAQGDVTVIAQGLADGNQYARKASPDLKQRAIAHLADAA